MQRAKGNVALTGVSDGVVDGHSGGSSHKTCERELQIFVARHDFTLYVEGEIVSCDEDLQFAFTSLVRTATTVTINYTVTYTGEGDITFGSLQSPSHNSNGYIYDDLGNEYSNITMTIGENSSTWSVSNVIPAGVPVNCSIKINEVNAKATMLSVIKLGVASDVIDEDFLYFKNVKI